MNRYLLIGLALITFAACATEEEKLPILGQYDVMNGDTLWHEIPDFTFMNQDSQIITNGTFSDKLYIADFFFTSCPSICPKVKKNMLRMYEKYEGNDKIAFVSHTIDIKHDSVPVLKLYATNLGVSSETWHFVTGKKEDIYSIADDYFVAAIEDPGAPGGFDHSGRIILVDQNRHIRAFCDGTDADAVDLFMTDVDKLLLESS